MVLCSEQMQWEKVKPKGRCQCHASSDGEGQSPNYLFHGVTLFLVVLELPEQCKEIRDRHHVLEVFGCQRGRKVKGLDRMSRPLKLSALS